MKILLIGKENFLVDTKNKKFNSKYGLIDLTKIKLDKKIKSSTGEEFTSVKPTIIDLLKKCKRMPQIVTTKDASQIISQIGIQPDWKCLDAGAGSGFLSLFIGSFLKSGKIISYEREKEFYKKVKENIKFCELEKIVKVKNKDILKGFSEKNLNLITLDMKYSEKIVKKCYDALKIGAWLVVYSPYIEQQYQVREKMKKLFYPIKTFENIQREWTTDFGFSHPKYRGLMHTGFLTFGRKVG